MASLSQPEIIYCLETTGSASDDHLPCDIIDEKYRRCIAIESLDDGSETFLAGSIPDLKFDLVVLINGDGLGGKINSCMANLIPTVTA